MLVENQHYLNSLLDKISAEGINSLTPEERSDLEKLSRGEELPKPELPFDKNSDNDNDGDVAEGDEVDHAYHMFFHYVLDDDTIDTEIGTYHTSVVQKGEEMQLLVSESTGGNKMFATPFLNGVRGVSVLTIDGTEKVFKLKRIPQDDMEMKDFVDKFIFKHLPRIIVEMFGA